MRGTDARGPRKRVGHVERIKPDARPFDPDPVLISAVSQTGAPAPEPSDATRAFDALRRLVRVLRTASPSRRGLGTPSLTSAQLLVLRTLVERPGLSLGELAERTRTTQSTVSEVVARLVESGCVRRRAAADDGRRRELTLTARGRAVVARAPRSSAERLLDALAAIPAARRRAIAAGLEEWAAAAEIDDSPARLVLEGEGGEDQPAAVSSARRKRAAR